MSSETFALSTDDLSRLVFTDDLTGLHNRRYLRQWLQEKFQGRSAEVSPLTLLMLDLDHFKDVNDSQGHLAGDRLLMQVAGVLNETVSARGFVVRYAGDEFVVVLPRGDRARGCEVAEAIRLAVAAIDAGNDAAGRPIPLSCSVGVASEPEDGADAESLLEAADRAMYQAKQLGRNRISDGRDTGADRVLGRVAMDTFPCAELIGRERELLAAREQITRCATGGIGLLLLRGRPGLGKSRLLGELVRAAESAGAISLLERCTSEERRFPYAVLLRLLDRFVARFPAEAAGWRERLPAGELEVLLRFLPTLAGQPEAAAQGLAKAVEGLTTEHRTLLFHGLVRSLMQLTSGPLPVLLLDDAENLDAATVDVFTTVLREAKGRLMICLAARTNDLGRIVQDAVARFVGEVEHLPACRVIELSALSPAGVSTMLDRLLPGRSPGPELDRLVHEATGGNPLFVEEAVKGLLLRRRIERAGGAWRFHSIQASDFPPTLTDVIRGQLAAFDSATRELLSRAAVIGPNFALDLLQGITGANEGETLDLLDQARRVKLIEPAGAPGDSDTELRFAAAHLRDVTYGTTEPVFRTQVHRDIGQFEEGRNQDRLPDKAAYLLYHFELGEDLDRASHFREMVQALGRSVYVPEELDQAGRQPPHGERESVIPEATTPLPEAAAEAAVAFVRGLPPAVRNLRMYPPGSLMTRGSLETLERSLREVLNWVPVLTLSVEQMRLHVNTLACDAVRFGPAAGEVARLLDARAVASMSFPDRARPEDLEKLLTELGRPAVSEGYAPQAWAVRLRELGITSIGLAQQAYVVRSEADPDVAPVLGELSGAPAAEMVPAVRDVLRHLAGAVENLVMYPPGSRLISTAIEQAFASMQTMLESPRGVLITEVDGRMLVNGVDTRAPAYGPAPAVLLRRLSSRGLSTLAFRPGLSIEELSRFLGALVREDLHLHGHKAWEAFLTRENFPHVTLGDRVYEAARRGTRPTVVPPPAPATVDATLPILTLLRRHLEAGGEEPEAATLAADLVREAERLHRADEAAGFAALAGVPADATRTPRVEVRRRAWALMAKLLEKPSAVVSGAWADAWCLSVENSLESETDDDASLKAVHVAGALIPVLVARGAFVLANRLLWAVFRRGEAAVGRTVPQAATQVLDHAVQLPELAQLVEAAAGDETLSPSSRSVAAREFLLALGARAIVPLLHGIRRLESLRARRSLAALLKDLGGRSERELVREVNPYGPARDVVRVLEVLEIVDVDVATVVVSGFRHPEEPVKRAAIDLLRRLPRNRAAAALACAVEDEDPEVQKAAMIGVGELRPEGSLAWVRQILKGAAGADIKQAACVALGRFDDPEAVPLLIEVLEGGRVFGWFGRAEPEVRASAAWALGQHESSVARDALQRALKDGNPAVRASAKQGLRG